MEHLKWNANSIPNNLKFKFEFKFKRGGRPLIILEIYFESFAGFR